MRALVTLLFCVPAFAQEAPFTADAIMARVAVNQDRTQLERTHYLYVQHARVLSRKGQTVRCEEITDSRIVPTAKGSSAQVLKLDGRLLVKGKYVPYTQAAPKVGESNVDAGKDDLKITIDDDDSMDVDLVENMRSGLTRDDSKDGIGSGLFPLTSAVQARYQYKLVGNEQMNGRDVFHITFAPKDKDDFAWKGDAYIDRTAFEPVVVRTTMSRKIPFAVRTLLGTSLPGLGFTVTYAPQVGDVWFPVSFGTEFKLHVLFFLNREIVISAQNREFEQTHVRSTILPTQ